MSYAVPLALAAAILFGPPPTQLRAQRQAGTERLPNIVIVYADDLGYGDLSCYNEHAGYATPRIDRLAAEGVRFTDAHSPCTICSPSRYGLLSGNLVLRTGRGPRAFEGPGGPSYLAPGVPTLADMLRAQGYRTAVFGKWHLGLTWFDADGKKLAGGFDNARRIDYARSCPLVDGPQARGFDVSFVTPNCPTTDPLYLYIENGTVVAPATEQHRSATLPNPGGKWRWDNDEGIKSPGYHFVDADVLFYERALGFVRDQRAHHAEQPFFLLLCTQIAHAPVLPAPGFEDATAAGPRGDFVRELDTLTGRLLDLLDELGIADDTLLLLSSDNGPETRHTVWMRHDHHHDPAGGFRGMKRDGWEGGHRVPLIARWPGRIPAGRVTSQLANATDLYATLASLTGHALSDDVAVDSFDLLPVLAGRQPEDRPVRPHMLTQSFRGEFQLRSGSWKLLAHQGSGGNRYDRGELAEFAGPERAPEAPGQLYDLARDPGETQNLWFDEPARRAELLQLLAKCTRTDAGRTAPTGRTPLGLSALPRAAAAGDVAPARSRPNVVLIVSDDQAFCDYGFMGSDAVRTPSLDQLAAKGLVYTRGYATPVCSPSLATLLTGRYPHEHGITGNDLTAAGRDRSALKARLLANPVLLPRALTDAGYLTMQTGKLWNTTYRDVGFTHGMTDQGSRHGDHGLSIGREGMAPILEFVDTAVAAGKPFFVWYAPMLPHQPHNPSAERLARQRGKGPNEPAEKYHAMVEWLDDTIGELDRHLHDRGAADDTLVVYLADNGWDGAGGLASRRAKLTPYELGIRTPIVLRWPGHVLPGRDEEHLASIVDVVPTILRAAGIESPASVPGIDLSDATAVAARRTIFVEAFTHDILDLEDPRASVTAQVVIDGWHKLILPGTTRPKRAHAAAPTAPELFDLRVDPLETTDLAAQQPETVARLRDLQRAFWRVR
ncbi:MAG: sulfatase-like hydrolase/transferase [Planctomycetota bacterium]